LGFCVDPAAEKEDHKCASTDTAEAARMIGFLRREVASEVTARRLAWGAGSLLLAACTALVLAAWPDLDVWASIGLGSGVSLAWAVIGTQLPRVIRGNS
jgi:hypothetical protein